MRAILRVLAAALLFHALLPGAAAWADPPTAGASALNRFDPGADVPPTPERVAARTTSGGARGDWSRIVPVSITGRAHHSMILDAPGDRLVLFGGADRLRTYPDTWTHPVSGAGPWSRLDAGAGPEARARHAAVFDPVRRRMIVFGGSKDVYDSDAYDRHFADTWALSLSGTPRWEAIATAGERPPARSSCAAVYDPAHDRLVVFGGYNGTYLNDLWELSLSPAPRWTRLAPAGGVAPGPRAAMAATYDPAGDRMLVVGGRDWGGFLSTVWELRLSEDPPRWAPLAPTGAPTFEPRMDAVAAYDPARQAMIVMGGLGRTAAGEAFELTLSGAPAWKRVQAWFPAPSARFGHAAVYAPDGDRLVVFGGRNTGYGPDGILQGVLGDTWSLSLADSAWTRTEAEPPSPSEGRYGHVAVFDAPRDRMVVFGGADYVLAQNIGAVNRYWGDVWSLSLGANPDWTPIRPSGIPPSARFLHAAALDPVRERMIVFGGFDRTYRNDVWALSLSGAPAWERITPLGTPPAARGRMGMVYDSRRDRMLIFGGWAPTGAFNDLWALDLSGAPTWTPVRTVGAIPAPRCACVAVYDAERDRLVITGGVGETPYGDTWALPLRGPGPPQWSQLRDTFAPGAHAEDCGILDPTHGELVVFAGDRLTDLGWYPSDDTWARGLVGSAPWRQLATTGERPIERLYASAIHDAPAKRMVVFGGLIGSAIFADLWALDLGPGSQRALEAETSFPEPPAETEPAAAGLALRVPFPNAVPPGALDVELSLPDGGPARLELFTVAGRRIASRELGSLGPGRRTVRLAGRDDLPPGVYFVRITNAALSRSVKAVVLR